jgi:hypothetical protein
MWMSVLLAGIGATIGATLGMVPALVAARLLGYLPSPRPPRAARRAGGVLGEPPPFGFAPAPERVEDAPAPQVLAAGEPSHDPPQLAMLAHARHQAVYDAAYAEQLDRVETLRSAIGGRRGKSPEPPPD